MELFEDELARLIVKHWDAGPNAILDALDGAIIRIEMGDEPLSPPPNDALNGSSRSQLPASLARLQLGSEIEAVGPCVPEPGTSPSFPR